jgi:hypothetical protein
VSDRRFHHAEGLLTKQGVAVAALAQAMLGIRPGDRLEPVQEVADRIGASVGTIQSALDFLQANAAIETEARGRLGSFALKLDYPKLWKYALGRSLVGAMPLPYSRRLEGLATGIREQGLAAEIEMTLRFLRGSDQRLDLLTCGECSWVLLSRFAAETAQAAGARIDLLMALGPHTYMSEHVLLSRTGQIAPGMRIGVDLHSADHTYISQQVAHGQAVESVPIIYSEGLSLLKQGQIDATIWSAEDAIDLPPEVQALPIAAAFTPALARLGEAVLVIAHGDRVMQNLLLAIIDPEQLCQIQAEVVRKQRLPAY